MLKRLLAVILTTTLVCTVLAYISYTPITEREANTMYESLSSTFISYTLFALPIILLSGFLLDFIIGMIINRSSTTLAYVPTVLGYGVYGIVIASLLILLTTKDAFDLPLSFTIAALTAMIYYSLSVVFNRLSQHAH
ncbi:hypothetical protein ITJ88_06700 [Exiguobacterium sp. TBG-PICH-001]|uniref:hypothetical protein n=1 Tax=Exiguobacterium abrahamii TaxID=2785532 RepID=UPI0018A74110|nr:hypothetical protein [Exiguobacterium sp. TBG-PICH-001]MBF8152973.1 hypothetical protein [Exiguobacterium sp. TBG-PICH-001]